METVQEYFSEIDEDFLFLKSSEENSSFFTNGLDLFLKKKDKPVSSLTEGQKEYLEKIENALTK